LPNPSRLKKKETSDTIAATENKETIENKEEKNRKK